MRTLRRACGYLSLLAFCVLCGGAAITVFTAESWTKPASLVGRSSRLCVRGPCSRIPGGLDDKTVREGRFMEQVTKATPEEVLMGAQRFLQSDWTHGGNIERPSSLPHTLRIEKNRSFFPPTVLGWLGHLTMMVLTLGSWLIVWVIWGILRAESAIYTADITAYPAYGGTRVEITSDNDVWRQDLEEWFRSTFAVDAPQGGD